MSATRPLRAAVIGAGYLGRFHAQKYVLLEEVELAAVVDADPARARAAAREFGCRAVDDIRVLRGEVDLVSVVVPTIAHYAVARDCLEAGMHVLVEKPLARTVEEAGALIGIAEARGRVLQVGHLERFNPAVTALHELLLQPLYVESSRLSPFRPRGTDVDVVLDLMIHDLDLILDIVKSRVAEIRAVGFPVLTEDVDIAQARLEFSGGCVANVSASRVSRAAVRKLRVFQPDAYFSVDLNPPRLTCWRRSREGGRARLDPEERTFPPTDLLLEELRAFARAVRDGTRPVVTGADGRRALEVALRISAGMRGARRDAGGDA